MFDEDEEVRHRRYHEQQQIFGLRQMSRERQEREGFNNELTQEQNFSNNVHKQSQAYGNGPLRQLIKKYNL